MQTIQLGDVYPGTIHTPTLLVARGGGGRKIAQGVEISRKRWLQFSVFLPGGHPHFLGVLKYDLAML